MNEKIKSAILGAQANTTRWEVLHSTTVILGLPSLTEEHARLAGMVKALDKLQAASSEALYNASEEEFAAIADSLEGWECAMDALLQDIGDECVRIVLGDDAAQAAQDAADLAAAKKLARKLGVAHTFCV